MWTSDASSRTASRSSWSRSSTVVPFRTRVVHAGVCAGIDRRAGGPEDDVSGRPAQPVSRPGGARGRATASTTVVPGPPDVSGSPAIGVAGAPMSVGRLAATESRSAARS